MKDISLSHQVSDFFFAAVASQQHQPNNRNGDKMHKRIRSEDFDGRENFSQK